MLLTCVHLDERIIRNPYKKIHVNCARPPVAALPALPVNKATENKYTFKNIVRFPRRLIFLICAFRTNPFENQLKHPAPERVALRHIGAVGTCRGGEVEGRMKGAVHPPYCSNANCGNEQRGSLGDESGEVADRAEDVSGEENE